MSKDKRIILITGANTGIGYDTAAYLAAASPKNHVIVTARNEDRGTKALQTLQESKPQGTLSFQILDVTSDDSIFAAAKSVESQFGRLDVLINNAGVGLWLPTTRESLHRTFETNVYGPAVLTDALAPLLKRSSDPRIINVSSGLGSIGLRTDPTNPYYTAQDDPYRISKAALNMLSTCQMFNYREHGFKVWAFCPGFVVTGLKATAEEGVTDQRKWRAENGAESSETSAQGILEIVEGKRDEEVNCFVQRYRKQWPW
ncbi:hypothetical protein N0V90_001039 [Kalmusia sp. IMI 367209]|nr:hypothetical protein N0V90_001039 [Kalmusia sp. IMI 367209]